MNIADLINGSFEFVGSIALWANVIKLKKDRRIRGVYWPTTLFFAAWGLWNCFYYPHLDQWLSFLGGCFITAANLVWCAMALYYAREERAYNRRMSGLQEDFRKYGYRMKPPEPQPECIVYES